MVAAAAQEEKQVQINRECKNIYNKSKVHKTKIRILVKPETRRAIKDKYNK